MNLEIWQIALICIIGYIMLYALIDRICGCFEECSKHKSVAAAYSEFVKNPGLFPSILKDNVKKEK